jgi:hypothetical protein
MLVGFGSLDDLAPYKLLIFFTNCVKTKFILLLSFGKVYTTLVSPSSLFFDKSRNCKSNAFEIQTLACAHS